MGGRRSPEEVVIAKAPGGTLALDKPRRDETLVSPQDPLAARQAAHTRAHDAARTLLSGLATPNAPAPQGGAAWSPPAPQPAPPGGTLLSGPLGHPPGPGASYPVAPLRGGVVPPPARISTAAFVAVAAVGVVVLAGAAFAGMYFGTRARVTITTTVEPDAGPPVMPPIATPPAATQAPPIATPPAPAVETAAPAPTPVPPLPTKPREPPVCGAYRQARLKPNANPSTLHALAAACTAQGGTVPAPASTPTAPPAPTPTPTPAPRSDPGF